jgi:AcrR family transcriptional regulator
MDEEFSMSTASRREREYAEREELILDHARIMLRQHGYLGLNLDRLAEATEYSKGTLYQHFETKEDIVLGIAVGSLEMRTQFFERAGSFKGSSRERIVGVGVADDIIAELYPEHFQVSQMVKSPSIWEKTSQARRLRMGQCEGSCFGTVEKMVREAIHAGDLPVEPAKAKEVAFGLMTLALGTHLVSGNVEWMARIGIKAPRGALRVSQHRLLDGWEWRPFTKDWDYARTERRVRDEVFPEETRAATAAKAGGGARS